MSNFCAEYHCLNITMDEPQNSPAMIDPTMRRQNRQKFTSSQPSVLHPEAYTRKAVIRLEDRPLPGSHHYFLDLNLEISMDRDLTTSTQISKTTQMCFISLRQMRSIKGCLTMDSSKTLASALVLSRIDYDKMALVSLPKVATQSCQSIINTTARLITGVRKYDHITPVLKELHWLNIDERIEFKIALQIYKCLSNEGPAYLTRDLVPVASLPEKQGLRLTKSKDVVANKHKLKSLGLRRFSVSGTKLWNNLPNSLKSSSSTKSFCRSLKTYLFNKSFPPS